MIGSDSSSSSVLVYPEDVQTILPVSFSDFGYIRGCASKPSNELCGSVLYVQACSQNHEHSKTYRHAYCNDPLCPVCFKKYIPRISEGAAGRVHGYWSLNRDMRPYHLVVSPPPGTRYKNMKEAYASFHEMLKKLGCRAAATVYHPYRIKAGIKARLELFMSVNDSAEKRYELIRKDVLGLGGIEYYLYYSPHFHAVAFGYLIESRVFEMLTGWMYRKIRYMRDIADISRVVAYLQSHTAWEYGRHTIRYWGEMSYAKMARKRVKKEKVLKRCPVCAARISEYHYHAAEDKIGEMVSDRVYEWVFTYVYWKRGSIEPMFDEYGKPTGALANWSG